jgi:hypothetical protein
MVNRARNAGTDAAATVVETAVPAEIGVTESEQPPEPLTTGPSSINPDYQLEDVVAIVNGQPLAMRDVDRSVRVARVLGQLSGDPAPENGSPELKQFQVQMLKRLVDLELMAQGAERQGLMIPGGDVDVAVDGFLAQAGKSRIDLETAMASYGVTEAEIDRWFRDARTANYFVVQGLMDSEETADRDVVTQQWLSAQWNSQSITINFYEPEPEDG